MTNIEKVLKPRSVNVYKIGAFIDYGNNIKPLTVNELNTVLHVISGSMMQGLSPFEDCDAFEIVTPNADFFNDYIKQDKQVRIKPIDSLDTMINNEDVRALYVFTPEDRPYAFALMEAAEQKNIPVKCHVFKRKGTGIFPDDINDRVTEATKTKPNVPKERIVGGGKGFVSRGGPNNPNLIPTERMTVEGFSRIYYLKPFIQQAAKRLKQVGSDFLKHISKVVNGASLSKYGASALYMTAMKGKADEHGNGMVPDMFKRLGTWAKPEHDPETSRRIDTPSKFYETRLSAEDYSYIKSVLSRKAGLDKKTGITDVYVHEEDGIAYEETALEYHKRHKAGGASDEIVAAYADETVRMMLEGGKELPQMIVTPPITWKDSDVAKYGTREDKIAMSIHHRTAQMISDNYKIGFDRETRHKLSAKEVLTRIDNNEQASVGQLSVKYDPMLMGEKQAEAKKMTSRVSVEGQSDKLWQQSQPVRIQHMKEVLLSSLGLQGQLITKDGKLTFDKDGNVMREHMSDEEKAANKKKLKEKFKGVRRVALLDDNVDKGATLIAMREVLHENVSRDIEIDAYSLFDMSVSNKAERETKEALADKDLEGRAIFTLRKDLGKDFENLSSQEKREMINMQMEDMRKKENPETSEPAPKVARTRTAKPKVAASAEPVKPATKLRKKAEV